MRKCAIPAITTNCLIKRRKISFGQTRLGFATNGAHWKWMSWITLDNWKSTCNVCFSGGPTTKAQRNAKSPLDTWSLMIPDDEVMKIVNYTKKKITESRLRETDKKAIASWRHWQKWKRGLGCCICVKHWSSIRQTRTLYGIMKAAMTCSPSSCNKGDSPSSHKWLNSTKQRGAKSDRTTISLLPLVNFLRRWTATFWNCESCLHIWRLMKLSLLPWTNQFRAV